MKDAAKSVIDHLGQRRTQYGDVRVVEVEVQNVSVKNGRVEVLSSDTSSGFGVRVLHDGIWGFASSSEISQKSMTEVSERAIDIAKAGLLLRKEAVALSPEEPHVDSYKNSVLEDPFQVPFSAKIDLLLEADTIMRREPKTKVSQAWMRFYKTKKLFLSTEGADIEQEIVESGGGVSATVSDGGEVQVRSFENYGTRGYEFVKSLLLPARAEEVASQAAELLAAPECPSRVTSVIVGSSQLALQVHESCGHPTELDRVLGAEAGFYGTSFLTLEKLGSFKYGSQVVNIFADATVEGALGSFGYDDEGVRAQRAPIVEQGVFVGYLTSRETAPRIGQTSNGTMRADGWNRIPLIRMTSINLEPGEPGLEELIADTKEGFYLEHNKSWSIDEKRLNFQFGTQVGWEIEGGKLTRMVKNPVYTGITPQFWSSCDAVCNREEWHIWGIPNCGKGEPEQTAHVSHGTSPARFRGVEIGVLK